MTYKLYCIYDATDDVEIWNARGGAYRKISEANEKLKRLQKENPDHTFRIRAFQYYGMFVVGKEWSE